MKIKSLILFLLLACLSLAAVDLPQLPVGYTPISVSITGYVDKPGIYQLSTQSRLSDALDLSRAELVNSLPMDNPLSMTEYKPWKAVADTIQTDLQALRSIRFTRGGKTEIYDLMKYMRTGDLSQNPLLKDGDAIHIPAIARTISIQGKINKPGDYEYIEGDKLGTLLELAQGLAPGADLARVTLYRYGADKRSFEARTLDLSSFEINPTIADLPLEDGDRIMIPEDAQYRRQWKVAVTGNVIAPGEYLISEESTLYDVLLQSGGPGVRGDLETAIYLNQTMNESPDPEFERLKKLSMGQMTPLEYNYLRAKLRQIRGKYAVDIQKIWDTRGAEGNIKLRDGDLLYVPEKLDMVWVSGQVKNPGLLPLEKGKKWKDYISAAGGFTNNRRTGGIRIIRASSGNWVKATDKIELKSGDMIFVPEKTDRDFWVEFKDVFLIASQIVTIVIGVQALTK